MNFEYLSCAFMYKLQNVPMVGHDSSQMTLPFYLNDYLIVERRQLWFEAKHEE